MDDGSISWRKRKKHFFVLSHSGKPIYSSCTEEPYESLRGQLELIYGQIEEYFSAKGLNIVGYFHANERSDDYELGGVAKNIGDHICRYFSQAPILLLDNKKLEALKKSKDSGAIMQIVGHSLGGGTAALLTYILREQKEFSSSTCVTFAPVLLSRAYVIVGVWTKQVQTLCNPEKEQFCKVLESYQPNIVYFQGERLPNGEVGSLVWQGVELSTPEAITELFGPTLPTAVLRRLRGFLPAKVLDFGVGTSSALW
ncbi:hypothetical protein RIF29_00535 [Crotalaria pallida]|uniref:Fungal lipase-like domain-containing protein n=1 Tax=Crotalaria pallida TaxID=3830 RepID=A0AAN9IVR5_CROPI